jgi:hypothetical protein
MPSIEIEVGTARSSTWSAASYRAESSDTTSSASVDVGREAVGCSSSGGVVVVVVVVETVVVVVAATSSTGSANAVLHAAPTTAISKRTVAAGSLMDDKWGRDAESRPHSPSFVG